MNIGKTQEELEADQIFECRAIVKNLVNFGVSEKQKLQIIYLIALELESRDALKAITDLVSKLKSNNSDIKFNLTSENADYNKNKLLDV
tara:strand:+ start:347 stop:613 length:267 start_codon:yes stop_codon:yes gene_type:complete